MVKIMKKLVSSRIFPKKYINANFSVLMDKVIYHKFKESFKVGKKDLLSNKPAAQAAGADPSR